MSLSEVLPGFTPDPEQPPQRRRGAARQQRKRKKQKRRRSVLAIILTVAVISGGIAGAWFGLAPMVRQFTAPKDYTGAGTGAVTVKIPDGASGRTIARVLTDAGVTKTQVAFVDAAKKDTRATGIQPGTYQLHRTMSASSALALLLDPGSRLTTSVTIREGARAKDILDVLSKKLKLDRADLAKAAKSGDIGLPKAADGNVEGFLFPATYEFQPDVTAKQALSAMVERGKATFEDLGIPARDLRDTVVEASIVEAEAGNQKYMGKVARVLDNRLADHHKLELDSTVSYATGKFGITTTPADRASTSPYNTYKYFGLPKGPISNPGEAALKAVLDPPAGKWFWFVTVNPDTGETKFASDEAGYNANVKEFQAWLRAH